ncbi:MAG TPA: 1,4-alpha-glucan branching protein GlgB [bacterium]|nr:1,4-alpha-glucan branching protein GlgB [bacterium]
MISTIPFEDATAIINSNHKNPASVLGMHITDFLDKQVISVRAFLPDAKETFVVDAENPKETYPMTKVHKSGLFEAIIMSRSERFKYKYKMIDYYNKEHFINDVYSFWTESLTKFDRYLFNRAQHYKIYDKMGAHIIEVDGVKGVHFAVWAPNAQRVSVVGNFNNWDGRRHQMKLNADWSGIWQLFIPDLKHGDFYKYEIKGARGELFLKADPYAFYSELRPGTASVVWNIDNYNWNDSEWLKERYYTNHYEKPISVYEVHLPSWMKGPDNTFLNYREIADKLIKYVKENNFTHIELMPILEHPFDGSWGYQVTGYFSPTSRLGNPEDFMYFVDQCHLNGIGVMLDWVPAHFPKDAHGLSRFDGTALYEHQDPRLGEHPDWGTKIFNFGRFEVKNFLISSALFWLDKYHIDGLRVDAVASMLYLDYSKKQGEWIPNCYGGRENLEAIEFLKHLNSIAYQNYKGIIMTAEESTAWPGVSKPTYSGGLGFGFKWNMGWMNDTLNYITKNPIHRRYHHSNMTFSLLYAFTENFLLPFSHDEVVHGKGSMINKMPGDYWQKFANLRALYTYYFGHPGKKLLFMGCEFGMFDEWKESKSVDWNLLNFEYHRNMLKCLSDLNRIYKSEPAMYANDHNGNGFEWINCNDSDNSVFSFVRKGKSPEDHLLIVVNFTPVPRWAYKIGVNYYVPYKEIFNSDSVEYSGSNVGNAGLVYPNTENCNGKPYALKLALPPLGGLIFKPQFKK